MTVKLEGAIAFLKQAEQLKDTLRTARTSSGREESTAEHTWRLCLMIMLFEKEYAHLDVLKLMKICIIHDLGEAISGDIAAVNQSADVDKGIQERSDFQTLIAPLEEGLQAEFLTLWDEYENVTSEEARVAKAFDKLETLLQHTQGKNDADFNYGFNLTYGKQYTDYDALTQQFREILDGDTKALAEQNKTDN